MASKDCTVCIVDDDKIYRFTIDKYLKMLGLAENVIQFSNAEDALEFIEENLANPDQLPDVILLDVNMPILDGWDFMKKFKDYKDGLSKNIRIYMVSSSIDERDRNMAIDIPEISDFIVKPIGEDKLRELIQDL